MKFKAWSAIYNPARLDVQNDIIANANSHISPEKSNIAESARRDVFPNVINNFLPCGKFE